RDPAKGFRLFCPGGARPPTEDLVAFIDEHRGEYGVEPICEVLPIAPSTYFEQRRRALQPETRPEREKQDERLRLLIKQVWTENHEVYGARKVWHALLRMGEEVARCTVERLMREMDLQGAIRGRAFKRTTVPAEGAAYPPDLVNRDFKATAPNQLWVDRKSTRLNSSHVKISYAVFCLKKKKK